MLGGWFDSGMPFEIPRNHKFACVCPTSLANASVYDKLIITLTFLDRAGKGTSSVHRTDQRWVPSLRESEANILFFLVNLSNRRRQLVRGV
jgi:hypothetical protein